ncbi:MAG TPA: hypothetical protein VFA68_03535 [Terriglobales bacterium]|nr:hypothetical protein [Terriglobales bacterium]
MPPDDKVRSWQEIAEEAYREKDPNKLLQLTRELTEALERRDKSMGRKPDAQRETA